MTKIILITLFYFSLIAQRFEANVYITADRLNESQKQELQDLPELIESYINNYDYFRTNDDTQIDITIQIIVESVIESGGRKTYQSQFFIKTPAQENFYDKDFEFVYTQGEEIRHNSFEYQYIGNFIDFYLYMSGAGELDTFGKFEGDQMYAKAREALDLGLRGPSAGGWTYREKVYKDTTHPLVKTIREAKYKYYTAENFKLDKNYKEMREVSRSMMEDIKLATKRAPNNLLIKQFFEAYYNRIVEVIDASQDQDLIVDLMTIDSSRRDFYKKYLD
ncbi:MAG: DUF4835 family protein [Calditrichaeota bacterium]|nr:DUF4835 family protein [Calditrichota bacterium]